MQLKKECSRSGNRNRECDNCRFYVEAPGYVRGECRFNPPVVLSEYNPGPVSIDEQGRVSGTSITVWPSVSAAERACGKWIQK